MLRAAQYPPLTGAKRSGAERRSPREVAAPLSVLLCAPGFHARPAGLVSLNSQLRSAVIASVKPGCGEISPVDDTQGESLLHLHSALAGRETEEEEGKERSAGRNILHSLSPSLSLFDRWCCSAQPLVSNSGACMRISVRPGRFGTVMSVFQSAFR